MGWLFWLGAVALLVAAAAVTGFKPRGTRHVAHTQMMGAGRVVLVLVLIGLAAWAYLAQHGH